MFRTLLHNLRYIIAPKAFWSMSLKQLTHQSISLATRCGLFQKPPTPHPPPTPPSPPLPSICDRRVHFSWGHDLLWRYRHVLTLLRFVDVNRCVFIGRWSIEINTELWEHLLSNSLLAMLQVNSERFHELGSCDIQSETSVLTFVDTSYKEVLIIYKAFILFYHY